MATSAVRRIHGSVQFFDRAQSYITSSTYCEPLRGRTNSFQAGVSEIAKTWAVTPTRRTDCAAAESQNPHELLKTSYTLLTEISTRLLLF